MKNGWNQYIFIMYKRIIYFKNECKKLLWYTKYLSNLLLILLMVGTRRHSNHQLYSPNDNLCSCVKYHHVAEQHKLQQTYKVCLGLSTFKLKPHKLNLSSEALLIHPKLHCLGHPLQLCLQCCLHLLRDITIHHQGIPRLP